MASRRFPTPRRCEDQISINDFGNILRIGSKLCGSVPAGSRICTSTHLPPTCRTTSATMVVVATTCNWSLLLLGDTLAEQAAIKEKRNAVSANFGQFFFIKSVLLKMIFIIKPILSFYESFVKKLQKLSVMRNVFSQKNGAEARIRTSGHCVS